MDHLAIDVEPGSIDEWCERLGGAGSCEMILEGVFPNVEPDGIQSLCGWPLRIAENVREIDPPTVEEVSLLRRLDPNQFYVTPGRY